MVQQLQFLSDIFTHDTIYWHVHVYVVVYIFFFWGGGGGVKIFQTSSIFIFRLQDSLPETKGNNNQSGKKNF